MDVQIVLEKGPALRLEGRPDQGTAHEVHHGTFVDSDVQVVIKLERTAGALEREASALTAMADRRLAPRLIQAGFASVNGLRTRVQELGDRLSPFTDAIPDWPRLACADLPVDAPLVITHGDPGPGNYLDDGTDGVLIDWELAHIAPQGLDPARLNFIALLGAGPAGYVARAHRARANAASAGYLEAAPRLRHRSRGASRWWMAVAATHFVHRRWQLGGHPGPWEDAARVLVASLS